MEAYTVRRRPGSALAALALLSWGFALACMGGGEPTPAESYHAEMTQVMAGDQVLSLVFLELAVAMRRDEAPPEVIAQRLEQDITPLAVELRDRAGSLTPPDPSLEDPHEALVDAWGARAEAYEALAEAWRGGDLSATRAAQDARLEAREDAASAVEGLVDGLAVLELELDPTPGAELWEAPPQP